MEQKEEAGKVQLKAILKGNAAQFVRPAAMSGFKVADFQMNPAVKESAEENLKGEIASLQSQVASLKGEIANLKNQIEQEKKSSHSKGVQEGKTIGETEGEKKALEKHEENIKSLQISIEQTFENLSERQKENFAKIESSTAEIAIAIAKRIFCEEAAQNPDIVARVIKEAFNFLGQEEKLKIRINPIDINSVEQTESFWKPAISSLKSIDFVFDETMEKGGCVLESENGSSIDMRVQTIFGHIEETVKKIYVTHKKPSGFCQTGEPPKE